MASKVESIDLDQLQSEVEKLLALLNDRQPGMMGWHQFLAERLDKIRALITMKPGLVTSTGGSVAIPALPSFSLADRLADTTKPTIYFGGQFEKSFLGQVEPEIPETMIQMGHLEQQSSGDAIIADLGGEQFAETFVGQMLWLIDNGALETNKWYLFLLRSQVDGKVWAVYCFWFSAFS